MYIKGSHRGYRGTEQVAYRAEFLLLLQSRDGPCDHTNTYGVVRKVALRQLGHFMMGKANLGGKWISVSGTYGSDGLPMTVDILPKDAKPLPREVYDAWNKGGGHNSSGTEAPAMRHWAMTNLV